MAIDPDDILADDRKLRGLARRLVRDAARADDVVQDAWLAALRRGPHGIVRWTAWLAGAVKHLASRERTAAERAARREAAAAAAEAVPSAAELAEREAARRRVMDALLALPDPYRAALALRYLEGLAPRQIAARTGVPVETARTRVKRGLELLRARLVERDGARASCLALVPLAARTHGGTAAAASAALEVLLVSTKWTAASAAIGAAVLTGAACWFWIAQDSGPADQDPAARRQAELAPIEAPTVPLPPALASSAMPAAERAIAAPEPAAVAATLDPATAAPQTGTLTIRLIFARDGSPARGSGAKLTCRSDPDPERSARLLTADDQGEIAAVEVAAGEVQVVADRGGSARAEVASRGHAEVTLAIPEGATIEGTVRSREGAPVAGASLFLSCDGLGEPGFDLAQTDAAGRYRIRDVTGLHLLGARAAGNVPSALRQLTLHPGATVRADFELRGPGGRVEGTVHGPDGAPAAGALVQLGPDRPYNAFLAHAFDDGSMGWQFVAEQVRCDALGRFAFAGAPAGDLGLVAAARGSAPARLRVDVRPGATARVAVHLEPGARIAGRVLDAGGEPAAGERVVFGAEDAPWSASARTGAGGRFTIEDLPALADTLAVDAGDRGAATTTVALRAGATTEVELALSRGLAIRGRVVDAAGAPRPNFVVSATALRWEPSDRGPRRATSGADGAFELQGCRDAPYRVEAFASPAAFSPSAVVIGVDPRGAPVALVVPDQALPNARVALAATGDDGRPLGGASVDLRNERDRGAQREATDPTSGRAAFAAIVPGTYRVSIAASGYAEYRSPPFLLAPNADVDLGAIRLERPGALAVHLTRGGAAWTDGAGAARCEVIAASGARFLATPNGDHWRAPNLAPGVYQVCISVSGCAATARKVEVFAGQQARVDVALEPGVRAILAARLAPGAAGQDFAPAARCRVLDATGAVVADQELWNDDPALAWRFFIELAPGQYRAEVASGERAGAAEFAVEPAPGPDVPIDLR